MNEVARPEDPVNQPFDPAVIQEVINGLNGFRWDLTPQGLGYWDDVRQNLEIVLAIAKAKEKAGG